MTDALQQGLFDPPVSTGGKREALVRFTEGLLDTWFETRVGVKPRKSDRADIRQLSEKFIDDVDALFASVFREERDG